MSRQGLHVTVRGTGCWAPGLDDMDALDALRSTAQWQPPDKARAPATVLPPGERRRAPASVLLACEVAQQACQSAGIDPATLASVFACTHGDLTINDYMCATLATHPEALSPTRFHNSVHNAAAGYWTIATRCHAPSTAISALEGTFATGLLQAAALSLADARPVLLVAYDTPASGPFTDVTSNTIAFGAALVVDASAQGAQLPKLHMRHEVGLAAAMQLPEALATLAHANSTARDALPLLCVLLGGGSHQLQLPAGVDTRLALGCCP